MLESQQPSSVTHSITPEITPVWYWRADQTPFGSSCSTNYTSSCLYCHWIHRYSFWPQIYNRKSWTKSSVDSVYLPIGELQTSSKAAEEMQKLGLRHLHNERKMENGRKGVGRETGGGGKGGERERAEPKTAVLPPLCFQKQWALREQWLQTKSWSIFICHCESQTGGTGFLPCARSSNWIWAGRKMRSPRTLPA